MMVTVVGHVTADATINTTPQGKAVCSFTVAQQERVKQGGAWVDGPTTFFRVSVWEPAAMPTAESVKKGTRVVVHGSLRVRAYKTRDGVDRQSLDVTADEVGVSTRFAPVTAGEAPRAQRPSATDERDPWAAPGEVPRARRPDADERDPWAGM